MQVDDEQNPKRKKTEAEEQATASAVVVGFAGAKAPVTQNDEVEALEKAASEAKTDIGG